MELINWRVEEVVGLCEEKLFRLRAVDEYSVQTRRAKVSKRVVFAVFAFVEDAVHIHVLKGVGLGRPAVAKPAVYRPYMESPRSLMVLLEGVLFKEVFRTGIGAVLIYLVESLSKERQRKRGKKQR